MMMVEFTVKMLMMMELEKGKEFLPIQVGTHMRGSGRMDKRMARVYLLGLMETYMRGSTNKTREMAMVFLTMLMVTAMRGSGGMGRSMARVYLLGVLNLSGLETYMRGSTNKTRKMAMVLITMLMVTNMRGTGRLG